MDNLEQVSDDELRRRLLQYGLPNIPVTITTRKTLIKKLRLVMDGEKAKLRRQTTLATRYSSDEDSDNNSHTSSRTSSRNTIAALANNRLSKPQPLANSTFARPSPVAATTRRFTATAPRTPPKPPIALLPPRRSPNYVSPLLQGSNEDSEEDDDYDDDEDMDMDLDSAASHSYNNNLSNDQLFSMHPSYAAAHHQQHQQQPLNGRPQENPSSSPYLSDFTQRLLNLRGQTVQGETSKYIPIYIRIPVPIGCFSEPS